MKKNLFGKETKYIFALPFLGEDKFVHNNQKDILRGGAEVARWAHNPKVIGSNPVPATTKKLMIFIGFFCLYQFEYSSSNSTLFLLTGTTFLLLAVPHSPNTFFIGQSTSSS